MLASILAIEWSYLSGSFFQDYSTEIQKILSNSWTWIIVVLPFVFWIVWKRIRLMNILSRHGIPGPKPHLIYGNARQLRDLSLPDRQKEWIEKYGKIMGYYLGAQPIVLVAEPDLARAIQVIDFDNFTNKLPIRHHCDPAPYHGPSLIISRNDRWRQTRALMTPLFTNLKLRQMTLIMDQSIDKFLEQIEEKSKSGEEFDFYALSQKLSVDVLIRTNFGIENNDVLEQISIVIQEYTKPKFNKFLYLLQICFPILHPLRKLEDTVLYYLNMTSLRFLWTFSSKLIQFRRKEPDKQRSYLLQALLDSKESKKNISAVSDKTLTAEYQQKDQKAKSQKTNQGTKSGKEIKLSEDEVIANCLLFCVAGVDTTSNSFGFVAHHLINYPDVQEKVRDEIRDLLEREGKLDFNTVNGLEYMDWVIKESLRIYPPLPAGLTRFCEHDYAYGDIVIPNGSLILFAVNYLQHDPDYWHEPEVFDPERFSPERKHEIHPFSWQVFGNGPRNCLGMRFGLLELKLTLAKLLNKYRLETSPKSSIKHLSTKCRAALMFPDGGIFLKVISIE